MLRTRHAGLDKLWTIAERTARQCGGDPSNALYYVGFQLYDGDWTAEYAETPINCEVFASTCMDGAHFSLLVLDDEIDERSPVVLTSPTSPDWPNLILGETLHEFLCLGCLTGWHDPAEIPFRPSHFTQLIQETTEIDPDARDADLLDFIRRDFDLRPWPNVGDRLFELQEQYLDLLQFQPSDADDADSDDEPLNGSAH